MARGRGGIGSEFIFRALVTLIFVGFAIQLSLVFYHEKAVHSRSNSLVEKSLLVEQSHVSRNTKQTMDAVAAKIMQNNASNAAPPTKKVELPKIEWPKHFFPLLKPLPALAVIEDTTGDLVQATLDGTRPTITGVAIILQRFLLALHDKNKELSSKWIITNELVVPEYLKLVEQYLLPFDAQYRGKTIFPIRTDGSIFISAAAYRDHLLGETLKDAFRNAKNPEKLFIGAVIQNCFGLDYTCKTGVEVVGKNEKGKPITKVSDAPPDKNGIADFCADPDFNKYCDSGQVRVLYVNETESVGPAVARYFASKLWGGETYFIQVDAHLQFAHEWDERYIQEIKATGSYPKSVLSSYPPGFGMGQLGESVGTRLCRCTFSTSDVEHDIIRINTAHRYNGNEPQPTQIPFIAAGFFMARAEFLRDVPFDPMLPWCFMGEEIALSMRAWTSGFNIYAPRKNLIAHQYRPGRMGLPKFWESVGRTFGKPGAGFSNSMQSIMINRVKFMVGYPDITKQFLRNEGHSYILSDMDHYGLGTERERTAYIKLTGIDFENKRCAKMNWCNEGTLTD